MKRTHIGLALLVIAALALAAGSFIWINSHKPGERPVAYVPATAPSLPTTHAVTTAPVAAPPSTFIDIVKAAYPKLPATRPMATALPLADAARLVLSEPIYMGPSWRADLWITRPDAPPVQEAFHAASDPQADAQVFVVRDEVVFAHWNLTEFGQWQVRPVVRVEDGYALLTITGRQPLPKRPDYLWDRAVSVDARLIVPTSTGVCAFSFEPRLQEQFFDLRDPAIAEQPVSSPLTMYDGAGLLAWLPWDRGKPGGRAARYVDGQWVDLSKNPAWQGKFLQLLPLRDGSVLQLGQADAGGSKVKLSLTSLQQAPVSEAEVASLVVQLSDADREVRESAFAALGQFGPGIHPQLQRLVDKQPPEGRARLRQLLRKSSRPLLGSYTLVGDELELVSRQADGAAVFYANQGVSVLGDDGTPVVEAPAWIAIRPGRPVEMLPKLMTSELNPHTVQLYSTIDGWVAQRQGNPPAWWIGNNFLDLLQSQDKAYSQFLGRDRRGRWLFRKAASSSTTGPAADGGGTLIIDPTLPDPEPRLPAWIYKNAAAVGWDKDGWPVATYQEANWILGEDGWKKMEDGAAMIKTPPAPKPSAALPATGRSTTGPATMPATTRTRPSADLILELPDTTQYYDGKGRLLVESADGRLIDWPLPPVATGPGPVTLIRDVEGRLFLFNQPGRVLRIKQTPDSPDPFEIEATFSKGVPSSFADVSRIWLDPAGRIVIANGNALSILFPQGFIPPKLRELIDTAP